MSFVDSEAGHAMRTAGRLALATREIDRAQVHLERGLSAHRVSFSEARSSLDFSHHLTELSGISIHRIHYGAPVKVSVAPPEEFYLLQFALHGNCQIRRGSYQTDMKEGELYVVNPDLPIVKRWSSDTTQLTLKIDRAALQRQLASELGERQLRSVEFDASPVDARQQPTLLRMIALMCADASGDGLGQTRPSVSTALGAALLSILLHTMPHNRRALLDRPTPPVAPNSVRRAEEFIRTHMSDEITLSDIARAAGVGTRAINKGFRHFRDTTPLAYLRSVRLSLARDKLLNAGAGCSVTAVASECGIGHLGRFADAYCRQFGEHPSQTLKRARR